jgi:hypothetical protein
MRYLLCIECKTIIKMSQPDRIKISSEFHVNGAGKWLSLEIPIGPKDDPIQKFKEGDEMLINAFKAMNPEVQLSIPVKQVEVNKPEDIMAQIKACKDIEELKTFLIVVRTNKEWEAAYLLRREELIKPKKKNGKIVLP